MLATALKNFALYTFSYEWKLSKKIYPWVHQDALRKKTVYLSLHLHP